MIFTPITHQNTLDDDIDDQLHYDRYTLLQIHHIMAVVWAQINSILSIFLFSPEF
jgi:hypothetical protein